MASSHFSDDEKKIFKEWALFGNSSRKRLIVDYARLRVLPAIPTPTKKKI